MSVNTADASKAIAAAWNASTLNATFKALWDSSVVASQFLVLNDAEAAPEQPFPYAVFEMSVPSTLDRMSGPGSTLREVRDVPISFHVYARAVDGDSRTAKEIAAFLAEEVMKVFGGHPTETPDELVLDNGNFLIARYGTDYGVRVGDDEHQWVVDYEIRVDVPLAV